jgi:hypothetical protein
VLCQALQLIHERAEKALREAVKWTNAYSQQNRDGTPHSSHDSDDQGNDLHPTETSENMRETKHLGPLTRL